MECPRCHKSNERGWNFCPFCGYRQDMPSPRYEGAVGGIFDKLLKRLAKQMEDIDSRAINMDKDLEVRDLSPMFREMTGMKDSAGFKVTATPNARGFSIKISKSNDEEPDVKVNTFGDLDENMQNQINSQLQSMGMKIMPSGNKQPEKKDIKEKPKKNFPVPKVTEEPKTDIKQLGNGVTVDMEIPGVKEENDIEITELENSVEVRAIAGDKAFFKILTLPEQFGLAKSEFKKGKLHLEFS